MDTSEWVKTKRRLGVPFDGLPASGHSFARKLAACGLLAPVEALHARCRGTRRWRGIRCRGSRRVVQMQGMAWARGHLQGRHGRQDVRRGAGVVPSCRPRASDEGVGHKGSAFSLFILGPSDQNLTCCSRPKLWRAGLELCLSSGYVWEEGCGGCGAG
jgi:hypothetical protein